MSNLYEPSSQQLGFSRVVVHFTSMTLTWQTSSGDQALDARTPLSSRPVLHLSSHRDCIYSTFWSKRLFTCAGFRSHETLQSCRLSSWWAFIRLHYWCHPWMPRQESYFHYLFGVEEEDYYGALNIETGESTLFMPRLPSSYAIWLGQIQASTAIAKANLGGRNADFLHTLWVKTWHQSKSSKL